MSSLGELFFSLGLDSQKFDDAIKKAKDEVAKLTGEASITINADASNVAAQVQDDLNKITGKKTEIKLGIDKSSKASVEELINDIAEAEKRLEHLKTKESWNTSAIERQEGFISSLKKQLEEAKAIKIAATEAKEAIQEVAQSTQTIQHVVREEDIELVDRLTSALEKQNEQLELRNRLDQGKLDAAEKNKAEREEAARIKAEQKAAEKAQKEAEKEAKARIKAEEKATKEAEREEAARLRRLDKESKAIQKQQIAEQKILEGRKKMQEEEYNLTRWARKQEVASSSIYESAEYKREQNLLKLHFEEQERIAKFSAQWMSEERDRKKKEFKDAEVRIRQEEKELELIAKRRKISEGWLNETRNQKDKQREAEVSSSRSELHNQLAQLQRLEQAIRKLQYMKVDLDTSDVDKDSEDYKKAAAALDAYIDKLQEMQGSGKRLSKNKVDDVLGADISELMKKANRVRNGGKWVKEELDEAKDSVSAFGEALGQAFNYYMIERFVRNLYTIGGEFQKQQIALQAMIGDVNKANSIFERTKDMAVMSPFTFSELASYTKQMAAYGIEYEELYDTTKRLADISAGVGVDMGRLILAFGQVRSAAVLRGQELRQFTEAGIPMVNELAKAFSRLENREVKAAEVFDKISRREVSFGMVKDVLFGMTDPGGRFFEMQEELAQSLAGQWSNLKDAWEIMIAEIADSANGPLNVLASVMRNIISGWRLWLPLISGAAVGITALNAGLRVTSMLLSAGMMSAATVANIANPLIGALTAVLGIAAGIGAYKSTMESAEDAQKRLNAEMETSLTRLSENERTANRYLDILSKTASKESDKEELLRRQKATLEVLRSMYGDIVQDVKLEELTTERILEWRQKIGNLTSKESGDLLQKNVEENLRALNNAQAELERLSKGTITENIDTGDGKILTVTRKVTQNEIDEATSNVLKFESLYNRAIERQQEYFNRQEEIAQEDLTGWREKAEELIKGTTLQSPKEDQGMQEYFKYLKEEYDAGKAEFELYAENNPITAANKASAKASRDAANRVNIGLGGVSFLEPKKDDGQAEKDAKEAERRGKEMAKSFAEGVKAELDKISSQWDLYKQLFELTGDKVFASTAFSTSPVWDEAAKKMREEFEKAIALQGLGVSADFSVSDAVAKKMYGELYDSWKEIKDRIEKNGIDLKVNTANAIKDTMSIEDEIKAVTNKMNADLEEKDFLFGQDSIEYKNAFASWQKQLQELKTDLWELSPAFKSVFKDTVGMSIGQIEKLKNETQSIIDAIGKGVKNEKTGLIDFTYKGKSYSTSEEGLNKLLELLEKLSKKSHTIGDNFKRLWSFIKGEEYGEQGKLKFGDVAGDLSSIASGAAEAAQSLSSMFDALGDDKTAMNLELAGNMLKGISDIGQGIATKDPFAILGGVTSIITSIAQHHDKKLDRAIQKSQLEVKKLENAYKNLQTTIERQLGSITDEQASKMLDSLIMQRFELSKQYQAEDEKKKTDQSKLEDYKQQMAELQDQIEHFYEDLAKEQYGVDVKGWAEQIAGALTDAFASGEDAAIAFDKTVSEILQGLMKEMIAMEVVMPAMANLKNYMFGSKGIFTKDSDKGINLSADEASGLAIELGKLKETIGSAEEIWEAVNKATGGLLDSTENASGGLSGGIQSITEDTANLLGSYLNSVRGDVYVQRTLIEQLVNVSVPRMSVLAEAQLRELNQIVANTKRNADAADKIYDLVNRVVDKGSNKLKV